jgi:hypothetical protein
VPFQFQDDGYRISRRSFSATDVEEMCDKLNCIAGRYRLEKTNKCEQNNYVIDQIVREHRYNVPFRHANSPAHRSDIKERVAAKKKRDFKGVSGML